VTVLKTSVAFFLFFKVCCWQRGYFFLQI